MGEGESCSDGRHIQPLWKLQETAQAVPSPVGRERVRVRVTYSEHAPCPALTLGQTLSSHDRQTSLERRFPDPPVGGKSRDASPIRQVRLLLGRGFLSGLA